MQKGKRFAIKAIRKTSHVGNKALRKTLHLSTRVENKATRILDGTDFSIKLEETVPLEKVYYDSLRYILPINPALPKVGQKPSVVLLLPSLKSSSFFGGTATALVVAAKLAVLKKMPLRIVQTLENGHGEPEKLAQFLEDDGVHIAASDITIVSVAERAYNVYGYLPMTPDDIFVASAWWDAYLLNQLPLKNKFIYLVQDFEPIFYNNSDMYVLAESTYKMNSYIPLCNTKLMYDFMRDRSYPAFLKDSAGYFEPAVSRASTGLCNKKKPGEKRRIFLYGRPNVHRNLFFSALSAIDYAFKADFLDKNGWEVYMAGQDNLPNLKLTSGVAVKNLGKMDMKDYIEFSKTIDIAVSPMMAPHPNYPTLEFASIGSMVVTTKYANKVDLSGYSPNIVMADIDAESMAGAINHAAKQLEKAGREKQACSLPADWHQSLDKPLAALAKQHATEK